jgi:hypothetical protein
VALVGAITAVLAVTVAQEVEVELEMSKQDKVRLDNL